MTANRLSGETTVVAIGDSAMWGTGTAYRFKPPNLVHKMLNDGTPMPPVQFRARGGGVVGRSNKCGTPLSDSTGSFDQTYSQPSGGGTSSPIAGNCQQDNPTKPPTETDVPVSDAGDDDYGYQKWQSEWNTLNREARTDPSLDERSIDNLKWSIRRDIGRAWPTHLQQLDQFANWSSSRTLDVPWDGNRAVNFYRDKTYPDPFDPEIDPNKDKPFQHTPAQTPPNPKDVDLVLLNGSTNDIGLFYMMDFRQQYNDMMEYIEKFSYRDNKYLLKKARERFPNALLVLVGYPVFLSEWTSHARSKKFLRSFGTKNAVVALLGSLDGPNAIEAVIDGGTVFSRSHNHYMRKAAAERDHVEVRNGDPGVMYVARGFGAINAYEGPDTWAWAGTDDDTYERRKHFVTDLLGEDPAPKKVRAPIGHPNRRGSIQTAKAIVDRYRQRTSASVAETVGPLDDGQPQSLRDSLRPYKLFPNSFQGGARGSLMHALTHRVVDSLQLRFYTGTSLEGVFKTPWLEPAVDLYLDISPGRSGNGESFRVDYESDKEFSDTPQFDEDYDGRGAFRSMDRDSDFGNDIVVTEVNVDPMMGRQMDGGVQTNYGIDRTAKEDNARDFVVGSRERTGGREISWTRTDLGVDSTVSGNAIAYDTQNDIPNDRRDYLPKNRWDTNRLDLGQIQQATLRVEGASHWAIKRIEFAINGELTWTTRKTNGTSLQRRFAKATENDEDSFEIQLFP